MLSVRNVRCRMGFTLLELVLVTLLIMILVGLSTPLFKKKLSDLTLTTTATKMQMMLTFAQESAVLTGKNMKMHIDIAQRCYQLFGMDAAATPPAYAAIGGRFGRSVAIPAGLDIAASRSDVVFYPDGHSDDATITVRTAAGDEYTIRVSGSGAPVTVQETNHA